MKRPYGGWPKYKSKKERRGEAASKSLAAVFMFWGIISLLTAWYYSGQIEQKLIRFDPRHSQQRQAGQLEDLTKEPSNLIGTIRTNKKYEVFEISLRASLPIQSWSFIEGEVLDKDQNYLFSFGKELWHEQGRDSEGHWRENKNSYSIKVTFPDRGEYYLNFKTSANKFPSVVFVKLSKSRGSALPHLWFGILTLIFGLVIVEVGFKGLSEFKLENVFESHKWGRLIIRKAQKMDQGKLVVLIMAGIFVFVMLSMLFPYFLRGAIFIIIAVALLLPLFSRMKG